MSRYLEEIERCFGHRAEWGEIEAVLTSCPCPVARSSKYPAVNNFLTYLDESIARKSLVNGQDPERIRFLLLRLMFGRLTEQERPRSRFTWTKHVDIAPEPDLDTESAPGRPESARTHANRRLAKLAVDWGVKAVVSTNYDLIFDQSLEDLDVNSDYCLGYSENHEFQRSVRLLKLHGSVNWLLFCKGVRKEANVLVMDPNENTVKRYEEAFGSFRVTPVLKPPFSRFVGSA